jgi:IS5 family transposase
LETNVHFPTDLNLLWDAQRKCLDLLRALCEWYQISGWRKAQDWERKLKGQMRAVSKVAQGGGADKEKRLRAVAQKYLEASYRLEEKVLESLGALRTALLSWQDLIQLEQVDYFHTMLIKQLDLVERRLLRGETIPHGEKIFSLFEPHTQWIAKGKLFPPVELGHKRLVTTDQDELILDYRVMEQLADVDEVVP